MEHSISIIKHQRDLDTENQVQANHHMSDFPVNEKAPIETDDAKHVFDKNKIYFIEYPVAEALYEGDHLARARIKFGKVMYNGKLEKGGIFLWCNCSSISSIKKSLKRVKKGKRDYHEFEAYY